MKLFKTLLLIIIVRHGVNSAFAQTWTQTGAPDGGWFSVASSADGSKLVAALFAAYNGAAGAIYTSTDSGSSWTSNNIPSAHWIYAASSADGTKLVAINNTGIIYNSTNSGGIWTLTTNLPNSCYPTSLASSADGTKLLVAWLNQYGGGVFKSVDSGTTWISNSMSTNYLNWLFLASSADASKVAVADNFGYIYASTNSGTTWLQTSAPLGNWQGIASSADGNRLVAVERDLGPETDSSGPIYSSTNAGLTWISNNIPSQPWSSISSSADGSVLVAVAGSGSAGSIYISTNSGTSWAPTVVTDYWGGGIVASSADGTKLVATSGNVGVDRGTKSWFSGYIYTSQIMSSPLMNITQTNGSPKLSWILPSTNFVIQQSADLRNWSDMTNQPALNLTNLQNEVILPPPGSNAFYRLKTP